MSKYVANTFFWSWCVKCERDDDGLLLLQETLVCVYVFCCDLNNTEETHTYTHTHTVQSFGLFLYTKI